MRKSIRRLLPVGMAVAVALAACGDDDDADDAAEEPTEQTDQATDAPADDLVGDRTVTVTPSDGVTDGQTVTVEWSGYTPNSTVNVIQCADPSGLKSEICNTAAAQFNLPAGAEGEGTVDLVVHVGETGPDGVCDATNNNCVIAVNEDLVDGVTAVAPITFV